MNRREVLRAAGSVGAIAVGGRWVAACVVPDPPPPTSTTTTTTTAGYGVLNDPDANGLRLPDGFTSRIVATTGQQVGSTGFTWHPNPDGGACFAAGDGGWIYVSNSETGAPNGGVSMIRFASNGDITDARTILSGSGVNCSGGATPWGTWLSCEEISRGQVYECDPFGVQAAVTRPLMGLFAHEAVTVDHAGQMLYLTEDKPDGGLYRYRPSTYPDMSAGTLDILTESAGVLEWQVVPDPSAAVTSTRLQLADTKRFNGGEGITFVGGAVYFTTKGDNRVWRYDVAGNTLTVVYDLATTSTPVLSGVDNVVSRPNGDLYVVEDGGDMQVVLLVGSEAVAVVQVDGAVGSEMTGPAFSPDGTRFYFSSQRNPGITYEVSGPWRI